MSLTSNSKKASWLLSAAVIAALAGQAMAATDTWTGATNATLSGANWTGGNANPVSGDSLVFTNAGANVYSGSLTNDLASGFILGGLTFNTNYTGPLTITGVNSQTINSNLTIANTNASANFTGKYYNVLWNSPLLINSGFTLGASFSGSNGTAIGAVTNNGTISVGTGGYGLWITGQYTGAGSGATATDVIYSNGGNRGNSGNPNGFAAPFTTNSAGVVFANGVSNNVGTLQVAQSGDGTFRVDGANTVVHVTKALKTMRNANCGSTILVSNGGQLVIDSTATVGYNATPGASNNQQLTFGGDGNANNKIEFQQTTLDLGTYSMPNGTGQSNYNNALLIGGLNLVTNGTSWTVGFGAKNYGINFGGADGGGWTVKGTGMTVHGDGNAGNGTLSFNNSRFIDVQAPTLDIGNAQAGFGGGMVIANTKTVTKKGSGILNINVATTGTGTLAVTEGTVNFKNATFNPSLSVTGGTANVAATAGTFGTLGSVAVGGTGTIQTSPDTAHPTVWTVGGAMTISTGATLNFNLNNVAADSGNDKINLSGANFLSLDGGSYTLNVNTLASAALTTDYTLIAGGAAVSGLIGNWTINLNGAADSTDAVQISGNNLILHHATVVATPTWHVDGGGNWTTSANWTGGVPNAAGAEADFADVAPNANLSRSVSVDAAGITVGTIKFKPTAAVNYTIDTSAHALNLTASSGSASIAVTKGTQSITGANGIVLGSNLDADVAGTATLVLQNVSGSGKSVTASGSGTLTFIGTGNSYSGASSFGGIVNIGDGSTTTTLSGTQAITVSGTMNVNANAASPFTAIPDLTNNGTVNLHANAQFGKMIGSATTINADSGVSLTIGRDIRGAEVAGDADFTLAATITGTNVTLVKNGSNVVTSTAPNVPGGGNTTSTWTGSLVINGGEFIDTLLIDAANHQTQAVPVPVTVNSGGVFSVLYTYAATSFSEAISGAGTVRSKAGTGVAFYGDGSSFTGSYDAIGSISVNDTSIGSPSAIAIGTGSTFTYTGNGTKVLSAPITGAGTFSMNGTGNVTVSSIAVPTVQVHVGGTLQGSLSNTTTTLQGTYGDADSLRGGTFVLTNTDTLSLDTHIRLTNLTMGGTGDVSLTNTANSISNVTVTNGTLRGDLKTTLNGVQGIAVSAPGALVLTQSGSASVNGAVAGDGSIVVNHTNTADTLTFNGISPTSAVNLQLNSGNVAIASGKTLGVSSINTAANTTVTVNGTLLVQPGAPKASVINGTLAIAGTTDAWTGTLDLNNDMIIQVPVGQNVNAAYAKLVNQLNAGSQGGVWTGTTGITSSSAANSGYTMGLGAVPNAQLNSFGIGYTSFDNVAVDDNSILVKYTLMGDVNLDGTIDSLDYYFIDSAFNNNQVEGNPIMTGYINGDFNYDGTIDSADYYFIDSNFNNLNPLPGAAGASPVPEPASLALLGLGALALLKRRKA